MGMKELKQKSISELQHELAFQRDEMREFNFKLVQGEVKNVRALRKVKKEIARILTILNIHRKINGSARLTINP